MVEESRISTLFLDIGGVLLTNGWDHTMRQRAAEGFGIDYEEMNERHHLTFDTYEEGKLTLDAYLKRVVFYRRRDFPPEDFKRYMFAQSKPFTETIDFMKQVARTHGLHVGAISNEGRELTTYRITKFGLRDLFSFFICSCFVHFRKPDADMYRMALDVGQAEPDQALYIDDRGMFIDEARALGMHGIHHTDLATTRSAMADLGLSLD
jgi:putative hydrolase of the HAD superfamily